MHAANEPSRNPAKILGNLRLAGSLLFSAAFQAFTLATAGTVLALMLFYSTSPYFQGDWANVYPLRKLTWIAVHFLLTGAPLALIWLGFWWMLYGLAEGGIIRLFYLHLLFAYLPLAGALLLINPAGSPGAMVPTFAGEVTFGISMALTAAVLFPFYSIGVYRFVISAAVSPRWKIGRFLFLCLIFSVIGLGLLAVIWPLAPQLYPGISSFPSP